MTAEELAEKLLSGEMEIFEECPRLNGINFIVAPAPTKPAKTRGEAVAEGLLIFADVRGTGLQRLLKPEQAANLFDTEIAAEREACAKLAEDMVHDPIAKEIRARKGLPRC